MGKTCFFLCKNSSSLRNENIVNLCRKLSLEITLLTVFDAGHSQMLTVPNFKSLIKIHASKNVVLEKLITLALQEHLKRHIFC